MRYRTECAQPRTVLMVASSNSMSCARMPKLLADASLRVTVMAPPTSPALGSDYVSERLPVDGPRTAIQRRLRSLLTQDPERFDWVILCDEDLISEVGQQLDEPWAARCFPVAAEAAQIVNHKTAFIAACQDAGIAVPTSRVCEGLDEALIAAHAVGFPLLMKADFGASGTTVWRLNSDTDLVDAMPAAAGRPFVLQQLLVGEAGVTEMLCVDGQPRAIVSSFMRGIDPPPFGPASGRLYRNSPQAEALAVRIAALTGFHGLCGFDWMQCGGPDGKTYVIEFHPRPTLGFHMAGRAGVDFAAAIPALFGRALTETLRQPSGTEVECLFFPKDFNRALRQRDLRGLLRWIPGLSINDFPWRDLGLLRALAHRALRSHGLATLGRRTRPNRPSPAAPPSSFHGDL